MNIVEINDKYKTELLKAIQTGKINDFKDLYFNKIDEVIFLLESINSDFIISYLFLCQFLCLQIDLYKKYSFLIRMGLLLKFC